MSRSSPPIRVFVIHRDRLLSDALASALAHGAVRVVGQASGVGEAIERLRATAAELVLLEAEADSPPERPGVRRLRRAFPELRVLSLAAAYSCAEVLPSIEAGACGFSTLDSSLDDLLDTIRRTREGRPSCPPDLAVAVFDRLAELSRLGEERRGGPSGIRLTPRERDTLRGLAAGLRNKEIARQLGVSVPTVKNHVHKILGKLGVRRRLDAMKEAHRLGLLEELSIPLGKPRTRAARRAEEPRALAKKPEMRYAGLSRQQNC